MNHVSLPKYLISGRGVGIVGKSKVGVIFAIEITTSLHRNKIKQIYFAHGNSVIRNNYF